MHIIFASALLHCQLFDCFQLAAEGKLFGNKVKKGQFSVRKDLLSRSCYATLKRIWKNSLQQELFFPFRRFNVGLQSRAWSSILRWKSYQVCQRSILITHVRKTSRWRGERNRTKGSTAVEPMQTSNRVQYFGSIATNPSKTQKKSMPMLCQHSRREGAPAVTARDGDWTGSTLETKASIRPLGSTAGSSGSLPDVSR